MTDTPRDASPHSCDGCEGIDAVERRQLDLVEQRLRVAPAPDFIGLHAHYVAAAKGVNLSFWTPCGARLAADLVAAERARRQTSASAEQVQP